MCFYVKWDNFRIFTPNCLFILAKTYKNNTIIKFVLILLHAKESLRNTDGVKLSNIVDSICLVNYHAFICCHQQVNAVWCSVLQLVTLSPARFLNGEKTWVLIHKYFKKALWTKQFQGLVERKYALGNSPEHYAPSRAFFLFVFPPPVGTLR